MLRATQHELKIVHRTKYIKRNEQTFGGDTMLEFLSFCASSTAGNRQLIFSFVRVSLVPVSFDRISVQCSAVIHTCSLEWGRSNRTNRRKRSAFALQCVCYTYRHIHHTHRIERNIFTGNGRLHDILHNRWACVEGFHSADNSRQVNIAHYSL